MNDIYIYTNRNCIYCKALRQYLIINNIKFIDIDIEKFPEMIKEFPHVPTIKIGSVIIDGFNIEKINKHLKISNKSTYEAYLDNASTTQVKKEVLEQMKPYMSKYFANPSSIYSIGLDNKSAIEKSRLQVANALNCSPDEIFFTSGGSESNNTAIKGVAFANKFKGNHIITSVIEHSSVLNTCIYLEKQGFEVTYLPVDKYGLISLDELKKSITSNTILISIMYANNEIGTIQSIKEIGEIAKENNIYFHSDGVQAIGKININLSDLNISLLSLSAHKFHGIKGIGALYIKNGVNLDPLIHGGNQENNIRAGTENLAGIIGLGKAIELAKENMNTNSNHVKLLRNRLVKGLLKIPHIQFNGHPIKRIEENINVTFKNLNYLENDILKFLLDTNKIYVSSGSACSENSTHASHVLKSIGLSGEDINKSLRITISSLNTVKEIDYFLEKIYDILNKLSNYYGI